MLRCIAPLLALHALVQAARLPPSVPTPSAASSKKRVLMLVCDTGGGHRASAQALEAAVHDLRPGGDVDVKIVDIWTEHGVFPYNKMAAGYPFLCKYPWSWRIAYYSSMLAEIPWSFETRLRNGAKFERCISEYSPDLIVSLHPLTQHLPLHTIRKLDEEGTLERPTFATVCTDLGGAHPSWFVKGVDAAFVPSDAVRRVATRRGLKAEQIKQYGLPYVAIHPNHLNGLRRVSDAAIDRRVRRSFWRASEERRTCEPSREMKEELGLNPDRRTVLVIGGGDGVGALGKIVESTAKQLGRDMPGAAQVVAICGKNRAVARQIENKKPSWKGVDVEVRGFTSAISDYMEAAHCLITKAGPGTIAEAAIRGLPTMLSSHLPGQEAGNVAFVVDNGFGEFSTRPKKIARTVSSWLKDDELLRAKSGAALQVASPNATQAIAIDLLEMLDARDGN